VPRHTAAFASTRSARPRRRRRRLIKARTCPPTGQSGVPAQDAPTTTSHGRRGRALPGEARRRRRPASPPTSWRATLAVPGARLAGVARRLPAPAIWSPSAPRRSASRQQAGRRQAGRRCGSGSASTRPARGSSSPATTSAGIPADAQSPPRTRHAPTPAPGHDAGGRTGRAETVEGFGRTGSRRAVAPVVLSPSTFRLP
jgi:hypothetical protein